MKKNFSASVFFFALFFLFVLPFEGTAQKGKYNKACKTNTIEAYQEFLAKYSDSEYSPNIKDRLINLEYEKTKRENKLDSFQDFQSKYPNSKYEMEVNMKIEELFFTRAENLNSIEAYQVFVEKYPNSKYAEEANVKIEELFFSRIENMNSIEGYQVFIEKYPKGKFTEKAKEKVVELEFEKAEKENISDSYQLFLEKFPKSKYTVLANKKLEELEFGIAKNENTIQSYESFLMNFPDSRFSPEIELLLVDKQYERAKEDYSFQFSEKVFLEKAREENTLAAYQIFLERYPVTNYKEEINTAIINLQKDRIQEINEKVGIDPALKTLADLNEFISLQNNYKDIFQKEIQKVLESICNHKKIEEIEMYKQEAMKLVEFYTKKEMYPKYSFEAVLCKEILFFMVKTAKDNMITLEDLQEEVNRKKNQLSIAQMQAYFQATESVANKTVEMFKIYLDAAASIVSDLKNYQLNKNARIRIWEHALKSLGKAEYFPDMEKGIERIDEVKEILNRAYKHEKDTGIRQIAQRVISKL